MKYMHPSMLERLGEIYEMPEITAPAIAEFLRLTGMDAREFEAEDVGGWEVTVTNGVSPSGAIIKVAHINDDGFCFFALSASDLLKKAADRITTLEKELAAVRG